jgi:molybdopterin-guanine dinucleotide biosynthesis protein A
VFDHHTNHPTELIDAILPAGGRVSGALAEESGATIKALIPLRDETLLEREIHALRETGRIGRIVVIGPPELQNHDAARKADTILLEGNDGPENIFRGLQWLQQQENAARRVLVVTTDLPFLTPQALTQFIEMCSPELDICVPVIERREYEAVFPDSPGVWMRLQDGEWAIGCAFLLNAPALHKSRAHLEQAFAARKSQLAMARLLGPVFIVRFLFKRLTIAHILERCRRVLGCTGEPIRGCAPELAYDIDEVAEYHYAVQHMQRTSS